MEVVAAWYTDHRAQGGNWEKQVAVKSFVTMTKSWEGDR